MAGAARAAATPLPAKRTGLRQLRQPTRRAGVSDARPKSPQPAVKRKPASSAPLSTAAPSISAPVASRVPKPSLDQASVLGKRKDREFEHEIGEDTSIHVVVRCRGRNDREVKENSGVVLSTDGVSGKQVDLSLGPNALSNKTYTFDKVFSPAADQTLVFEEVVLPIINDMLAGYNCTIFAYGQTGTGKTYTMSGDMTDTLGILSDDAGIIPRTLYSLFAKLEDTDSTVKCSFIELYNEQLRDLLSYDDNTTLKIFENEKKGQTATFVQGMEESFIDSASTGIKLLQMGSHKRQVAATKCNDLSSRSHTIFTITVMTKRTTESGEDYISSGKLNLVDLAGSENIGRSGAENKRAVEAGLINKSLLTLGRVINALVDKSSHIPYRESKLTRLLQDSLGGRTKTCIIATVSQAKSNLEETISTLDYAFRAKNIRNKPQVNSLVSKNKLLRDIGIEIERLRSDLIATRHRNGVYMTPVAFEEMTVESESRRIVNEEQRAKIESMESSMKHKVQELFSLTGNFNSLKEDNESIQSEFKKVKLDVEQLHAKVERKDDIEMKNSQVWQESTNEIGKVTRQIDARLDTLQARHSELLEGISIKTHEFLANELASAQAARSQLQEFDLSFEQVEADARIQASGARDEMNEVLEEIKVLRGDVKAKVGEGLNGVSAAAARISKEVIGELSEFHSQLHTSYSSLGKDIKAMLDSMAMHIENQKSEIDRLRLDLQEANRQTIEANRKASSNISQTLDEELACSQTERDTLMSHIQGLLEESSQRQSARLKQRFDGVRTDLSASGDSLEQATSQYDRQVDEWMYKEVKFAKDVAASKEEFRARVNNDCETFDERNASIQRVTKSVHQETVKIVEAQMVDVGKQMEALDDFVTRARSHNGLVHEVQLKNLGSIGANVRESRAALQRQLDDTHQRIGEVQEDFDSNIQGLKRSTVPLLQEVRDPLLELQANLQSHHMTEYIPTGQTPQRR